MNVETILVMAIIAACFAATIESCNAHSSEFDSLKTSVEQGE